MSVFIVEGVDKFIVNAIHAGGSDARLIGPLVEGADQGAKAVPERPEQVEDEGADRVVRFQDYDRGGLAGRWGTYMTRIRLGRRRSRRGNHQGRG